MNAAVPSPAVVPSPVAASRGAPGALIGRAQRLLAVALLLAVVLTSLSIPAQAASSFRMEATYDVSLHLDWNSRRVRVQTTIDLRNTSGGPVDHVLLNTAVAKLGSMRKLNARVDGNPVKARRKGQTIKVPLGFVLPDGAETSVRVAYRARLRTGRTGRDFMWTKVSNIVQMYRFIPWLSRRIAWGGRAHGEPFLTPSSPSVRVTASSDRNLVWATTGARVARDGKSFTFQAQDVRDFNLTASPGYRTARGKSKDGRTSIIAYTRSLNGRRLVRLAKQELARYKKLTGVAYPHSTYRIAESTAGLAMESPGLIWIPASRPSADQPFLVSHETAHQWWYSTVGNDQSTNAFADEALADYFSRRAHLSIRASRCPRDRLDRDIRRYSSQCYFEVIYVQGARFLNDLRRDFGNAKFKRAIRRYTRDNREGIGSNAKLLEAFREEMGSKVLKRFRTRFPSLY